MDARLLHEKGLHLFQGDITAVAHLNGGRNDHGCKGHEGKEQGIEEDEAIGAAEVSAHVAFFLFCHDGRSPFRVTGDLLG